MKAYRTTGKISSEDFTSDCVLYTFITSAGKMDIVAFLTYDDSDLLKNGQSPDYRRQNSVSSDAVISEKVRCEIHTNSHTKQGHHCRQFCRLFLFLTFFPSSR